MKEPKLHLKDSKLTSTFGDGTEPDSETEARFYVHAIVEGEDKQQRTFMLEAMTSERYRDWFMEREVEGEIEDEVPPLVIPDDYLATGGLVAAVEKLYLDKNDPDRINLIRRNLHGPFDNGFPAGPA